MCFCGKGCYVEENNKLQKNKCERPVDYHVSAPDYGGLTIEMIRKMRNNDYLKKIYSFAKVIYNKEQNEKENS